MSIERVAVFPGTFDPFTHGHLDLVRRTARLFDRVVVLVAHSPAKGALFPVEERVELIRAATRTLRRVEVAEFSDLVVDAARRHGGHVMIRGVRWMSDFEFEFQMALMNRRLAPGLEVLFMMPSPQYTYVNSTLVKEVARLGGSIRGLVPKAVEDRLRRQFPHAAARRAARGPDAAAVPAGPATPARRARGPAAASRGAAPPRRKGRR